MKVTELYTWGSSAYELMIALSGHRRSMRTFFNAHAHLKDGVRIMDAGCGSGAVLGVLHGIVDKRRLKAEFYGFDLTPAMLRKAQLRSFSRVCHRISLMPADVRDAPHAFPEEWTNLDLIVSAGMLEYLPKAELAPTLAKLRSMLRPGGHMVIFISRDGAFNRLLLGRIWKANLYTESELIDAFSQANIHLRSINRFRSWGFAIEAEK